MSRESIIVLGSMIAVVAVLVVVKYAYVDIAAWVNKPSAEQIAQEEQSIGELDKAARAADADALIAAVAPCKSGGRATRACVTVTSKWQMANNRKEVASALWKNWADICTARHLASQPRDCFLEVHSDSGETLGGSGEDDGTRIWVKDQQ